MESALEPEPNPSPPVTIFDIIRTGFTLCVRLPWVVSTTLFRRWWPWNNSYKPPPFREHVFRHVMTCLGNHVPLSVWQWYTASDTSGSDLKTSVRYGRIPHIFEAVRTPDFSGYWICRGLSQEPLHPRDADLVLLHAHGGGYVAGHPSVGAPEHVFVAEILQKHNLTTAIFSLDYTLAPKATFPQQRDEALAAYDWLRGDMGIDASKIIVIGDSAGGHVIMSLLVGLYERRIQQAQPDSDIEDSRPAAAVLVSPWMNLHTSHPRALDLHWEERLFKRSLDTYCKWILRDTTAELDLLYGNFALGRDMRGSWADILPSRTWITAGAEEFVFLYDIEDFVLQAKKDGADVALDTADGRNHTWQCAEAFGQQSRLLALPLDKALPEGLMEGYRVIAMKILELVALA
ncbi:Alpha/Beta hydrolase protein [Aspergillus cavernicola]|uniref:Alpha/Beta hydrolase protein n=1 Tax=Aspergillus cavernicola TaxID=176166 RepID=A0ABR4I7R9_9EURO